MEEQRFASGLRKLQNLLEDTSASLEVPILFALIGGFAVSTWGAVRATQEIDLLVDSTPSPIVDSKLRERIADFLRSRECEVEWRSGAMDDPVPLLLRVRLPAPEKGITADLIWAHKWWHGEALERTVKLHVLSMEVILAHPEDLILLKLDAGGPQDLLDIEALLSSPVTEIDLVSLQEKAARVRRERLLEECLKRVGQ